jgi:hypothetical protein
MDEIRRIRLLIAPALFIASILWGAWWDPDSTFSKHVFRDHDWSNVIGLIAGGGFVVFVGGYIIGTITYVVLRQLFRPLNGRGYRFHEIALSKGDFQTIWDKLGAQGTADRERELFAGVAFDHGLLRKNYEGIHEWCVRHWTAFNISVNSICGLILSFPIGILMVGLHHCLWWSLPALLFIGFLLRSAVWAWNDAMLLALPFLHGSPSPAPAIW